MIKHITLDLDDFSILNNRFDLLFKIKEHYPKFKVSMFTIPYEIGKDTAMAKMFRPKALQTLKENLDWIQIIPHGLTHMPREFEKADKTATNLSLKAIDEKFKEDGIPYVKGFKAPYWLWNQDVVDVLDHNGWWGAVDINQADMIKTKTYYEYEYSLAFPFWKMDKEHLKLHGHIDGVSDNDLGKCLLGIFKLHPDIEWHFVTEDLCQKP